MEGKPDFKTMGCLSPTEQQVSDLTVIGSFTTNRPTDGVPFYFGSLTPSYGRKYDYSIGQWNSATPPSSNSETIKLEIEKRK